MIEIENRKVKSTHISKLIWVDGGKQINESSDDFSLLSQLKSIFK